MLARLVAYMAPPPLVPPCAGLPPPAKSATAASRLPAATSLPRPSRTTTMKALPLAAPPRTPTPHRRTRCRRWRAMRAPWRRTTRTTRTTGCAGRRAACEGERGGGVHVPNHPHCSNDRVDACAMLVQRRRGGRGVGVGVARRCAARAHSALAAGRPAPVPQVSNPFHPLALAPPRRRAVCRAFKCVDATAWRFGGTDRVRGGSRSGVLSRCASRRPQPPPPDAAPPACAHVSPAPSAAGRRRLLFGHAGGGCGGGQAQRGGLCFLRRNHSFGLGRGRRVRPSILRHDHM